MDRPSSDYDAFLSYNSRDHQAVDRIGEWLKGQGLTCFMDRWYLVPGTSWLSALERRMERSKAVVVFIGPGDMGRWQQREVHRALDRQASSMTPVIPVLLPDADPPLGFLKDNTWVNLRARLDEEYALRVLAGAVRGLAPAELGLDDHPVAATVCPFRGLLPFREEDAPFFFGREDATARLVEAVARHPFVAVVGASGSGKSSVVRAGLVPRLRADPSTVWEVATMVPTARPLNSLVNALSPLVWPDLDDEVARRTEANKAAASLEDGTLFLRDLVEISMTNQPGTQRLLLVVDQWEELYTLCRDDKAIRLFRDQLLDASESAPLTVIFTCRADFYGHVLGHRPLVERIACGAQVALGPMDERDLKQVIEAPAAKMGLEFDPFLADQILDDMGRGPGRLPLLSFLLEQLWNQRRGAVLTNEAFQEMGGVEGAIATVAERVFVRLPEADQTRLARVFIQLVSVGEESEDTRRRAAMATLGDEARPLVAELVKARLLVTDSDQATETVEVAHEALIRHWKRSQAWVNNARGFLTWRERMEPFLRTWQTDDTAFLRGGLLVEAREWLDKRRQDLDPPEIEFIEKSLRKQKQDRNAELRMRRRLLGRLVAARVFAIFALAAAFLALYQWGIAAKNETLSKANETKALRHLATSLANQSALERAGRPQRSVLLAAEAIGISKTKGLAPSVVAEQSLRDSLDSLRGLGLSGHSGSVKAVAITPDGRWVVTGGEDKVARVYDLKAARPATPTSRSRGTRMRSGRWRSAPTADGSPRGAPIRPRGSMTSNRRSPRRPSPARMGTNMASTPWPSARMGDASRRAATRPRGSGTSRPIGPWSPYSPGR